MTRRAAFFAAALLLGAAACAAEPEAERGAAAAAEDASAAAAEPASWSGRSPSGALVRVRPASLPLHPGTVRFEVTVEGGAAARPLSADLVSPTMPEHGITRFEAAPAADGGYAVVADIPMEGRWMLYVNLDHGDDAVPFEFDVVLPDSGSSQHRDAHRGHAPGSRE